MSSLKINRLVVIRNGKAVYDEKFHSGVNIIRGENSSGKSTISNFIFFVLGGEFTSWLPEALACDYVIAELTINGRIITVKRAIEDKRVRPMSIYYGDFESSSISLFDGWMVHPYAKSENVESFSQILFKLLDFPEISTENQESITINQVLRLIYIDQLSALDSLMRNEDFDSPSIRTAVGYLLLGTYDDELLKMQIVFRDSKKRLSEVESQLKAILDIFKHSSFESDPEKILQEKQRKEQSLEKVLQKLSEPIVNVSTSKATEKQLDELRAVLIGKKREFASIANNIEQVKLDLIDSSDFINILKEKIQAIKESILARSAFKDFAVSYCPVCLEKLEDDIVENTCHLCKKHKTYESSDSKVLRMRLELEMQLKESLTLFDSKGRYIKDAENKLDLVKRELKVAQSNYDIFIKQTRSTTETFYDNLLEQKGKLTADIEFLDREMELNNAYNEYRVQLEALKHQISDLEMRISVLQSQQQFKSQLAFSKIREYTIELLKGDGTYEKQFSTANQVEISFATNSFELDGRKRFSASSMVLLKNCIRFAIFFASVELPFFRYPKFILCDNIEDKGMVEARSRNFQMNIVKLSNQDQFKGKEFQIIFSTSMVKDELNTNVYTIGDFYSDTNKSIK